MVMLLGGCNLRVLDPQGTVGEQQRDLIILSIIFMLIIVLVVFILLTYFLVKYREREGHRGYDPDIDGSVKLEVVWTVVPIIIVTILSVPTVYTIFNIEEVPEANTEEEEPLVIHATSANWKWIFSYPEEDIETVNYINIPAERPVLFRLTSADSMASFWVPQLGGQRYNMAGMQTELYLQAGEEGTYYGRNANFTGEGFAEMRFDVNAIDETEFNEWVTDVQEEAPQLTQETYDQFMVPGHVEEYTFSGTHLEWVDHALDPEYALEARARQGYEPIHPHASEAPDDVPTWDIDVDTDVTERQESYIEENQESDSHHHHH
ncbi:cytochrome aa3 quinol oxidase subunit II [Natribacillus halophilus]|uniref:Quinol oxidase subunit 2 n=1 Tax=Natribacillus halophilus TaxID=549003 RepID=A0A1G8Q275_9BACI|nr:cytochrome aa3 quinol oxidase subunit II [Natribacillus halophilus]SDI98817.1 cytochrome aa3 quinol oxidase subunit 2 [Natribacillus halophilus]